MLSITLKRKRSWFIGLFHGLWTLGVWVMFGVIAYGCITDDRLEPLLYMLPFFFASLFTLKSCLWLLRGKEIITVDDDHLHIRKAGTILTIPARFAVRDINDIKFASKDQTPTILKMYGVAVGRISFDYKGSKKYFGQTLGKEKALKAIELINQELTRVKAKLESEFISA